MTITSSTKRCSPESSIDSTSMYSISRGEESGQSIGLYGGTLQRASLTTTHMAKRKVSFDESVGASSDLDVTSRFLTSQYTSCMESPKPSSNASDTMIDHDDSRIKPCWSWHSRSGASSSRSKVSHDIPSKPTLSRLSRSGCLCLLDRDASAKRRRSIKGNTVPSVSEEDMNVHIDGVVAESVSVLSDISSSLSHAQTQTQTQTQTHIKSGIQTQEEKSFDQENLLHPSYWGHFVDFLSPDLEQPRNCKYKKGDSLKKASRYRPHPKTPTPTTSDRQSVSLFFSKHDWPNFEEISKDIIQRPADEISYAMEKISL